MEIKTKILNIVLVTFFLCSCQGNRSDGNVQEEYYGNGNLRSETPLKGNLIDGVRKEYDVNGKLVKTIEYANGNIEGFITMYNPANGKVTYKATIKNNVQEGLLLQYYDNGAKFKESTYVGGRIDGEAKTYWPDSTIKSIGYYKKGKPGLGLKEFDRSGNELKMPTMVTREIKDYSKNTLIVEVSLSKGSNVEFYVTDLEDGRYFPKDAPKIESKNGVAKVEYKFYKGAKILRVVNFVAKYKTIYGNTLVLQKKYKPADFK